MGQVKLSKAYILIILSLCLSCQTEVNKDKLPQLLGVENVRIEDSDVISQFGGFGEGYAIEEYVLSESTIISFKEKSRKKLPPMNNWSSQNWIETPVDITSEEAFIMILYYHTEDDKLLSVINRMKKALKEEGAYYSFYSKPDKENPQRVKLYILDTKQRILFIGQADY